MTDEPSWSEDDSGVYRNIARYAVPERERQIEIVTGLVRAADTEGDVLDLCCGEGLLSEAIMVAFPDVRILAYDGSDTMLAEARRRVPDPDRLTTKCIELAAADWRSFETPLRAVVSSLAIHHLNGDQKQELFADLYAALSPGGVVVLADIVKPATQAGCDLAAKHWDEEVKRRALALDGTLAGAEAFDAAEWNSFRHGFEEAVDKPSLICTKIDWFSAAGFADVDLHWMIAGHAIISGWRR